MELFLEAYEKIRSSNKEVAKYLEDPRLNHSEKRILSCLILLMRDKPLKAIEILNKTTPRKSFLIGFKNYVLGICYNHICKYNQALEFLHSSLNEFREFGIDLQIKPLTIMCYTYSNIRDLEGLESLFHQFQEIKDDSEKCQLLELNFNIYLSQLKEDPEATLKYVDAIFENYHTELQRTLSTYYTCKFSAYVQMNDLDECYQVLSDYKKANGFKLGENYIFMLSMLNYVTKNAPIYAYERDFEESSFLFNQLKVVQALGNHNKIEAEQYWQKLAKLIPTVYQSSFEYLGGKDIFSYALQKALSEYVGEESTDFSQADLDQLTSNNERLLYILNHSKGFIDKDKLINLIWNEPWSPKNDGRLRTLISRVKSKHDIFIEKKDGKYRKVS